jgi:hypothetical protein
MGFHYAIREKNRGLSPVASVILHWNDATRKIFQECGLRAHSPNPSNARLDYCKIPLCVNHFRMMEISCFNARLILLYGT